MVRLLWDIVAVVVPQLIHCGEKFLTLRTPKTPLIPRVWLLLWGYDLFLLLFMLTPMFDEAAAVLKGKAAFFTGEWGELILVCMEVTVKVKGLPSVEPLPTLLALQTPLPWLCECIILLSPACIFIIPITIVLLRILYPIDCCHQFIAHILYSALLTRI